MLRLLQQKLQPSRRNIRLTIQSPKRRISRKSLILCEVQQIGKALFALTNNTTKPVTVESVVNRGSFYRLDMPLEQWTLDPYETFQFMALGISGLPLPQNLVLKFVDREDPVKVALIKSL